MKRKQLLNCKGRLPQVHFIPKPMSGPRIYIKEDEVLIPATLLTSCVALGKSLSLLSFWFSHLKGE